MNKKIILILLISVFLVFSGCSSVEEEKQNFSKKNKIVVTFSPLKDLTEKIVGDSSVVTSIVPTGADLHSFEPTPQDIVTVSKSDLFLKMNFGDFEHLEEEILESSNIYSKKVTEGIELIEFGEHNEEHEHEGVDPHVWLSISNMKIISENIKNALVEKFPENKELYENNYDELIKELDLLDNEYKQTLSNCSQNTILVSHNAFSYLSHQYGFETVSISGLEPESEPTPQQIKELVETAREHNLKYVFYEENVDPRVSKTIASEVGAEVLELTPISEDDYFTMMRNNLINLKIGLDCN